VSIAAIADIYPADQQPLIGRKASRVGVLDAFRVLWPVDVLAVV
jgi:hypothetical protein